MMDCLPLVSSSDSGFIFGGRRFRGIAGRPLGVIVFGMLGQHLFGAVQRVWLPNATAVPVQVVATAAVLVGPLVAHARRLLLLLRVVARSVDRSNTADTGIAAHAPIAVIILIVLVLPIVVVGTSTAAATSHLKGRIGGQTPARTDRQSRAAAVQTTASTRRRSGRQYRDKEQRTTTSSRAQSSRCDVNAVEAKQPNR